MTIPPSTDAPEGAAGTLAAPQASPAPAPAPAAACDISVVMPCLNEAATVATCIAKARRCLERTGRSYEIVIADNGSTDGSPEIAREAGARVVNVAEKGYGSALMGGFLSARGRYLIMGDCDDSYDFERLEPFIEELDRGADLVMGNRFKGGIRKGAMPTLHRYLGTPVITWILNRFFGSRIGDANCGMRGFRRDLLDRVELVTTGMEFASEMVIKAAKGRLRIGEVPTTLDPDGRDRPPHLKSWRDGWRHLRFMLLHAPDWLYLVPGVTLFVIGSVLTLILALTDIHIGKARLAHSSMICSGALALAGYQVLWLGACARVYATTRLFKKPLATIGGLYRVLTLERALVAGLLLLLAGAALMIGMVVHWFAKDLGDLAESTIKTSLLGATLLLAGLQTVFNSFMLGMLVLPTRR